MVRYQQVDGDLDVFAFVFVFAVPLFEQRPHYHAVGLGHVIAGASDVDDSFRDAPDVVRDVYSGRGLCFYPGDGGTLVPHYQRGVLYEA